MSLSLPEYTLPGKIKDFVLSPSPISLTTELCIEVAELGNKALASHSIYKQPAADDLSGRQ